MNDPLPIRIGVGIVDDDTPTKIGMAACVEGSNIRWRDGLPQTWGGWEGVSPTALTGIARGGFTWRNNSGVLCTAIGTHQKLYVIVGGDVFDITPVSGFTPGNEHGYGGQGYGTGAYSTGLYSRPSTEAYFPLTWSFGAIGDALIANPRGQGIFIWSGNTAAPAIRLAEDETIHDSTFSGYADQTAFDVNWTRGTGWTFDATNDEADSDGSQSAVSNLTRTVTTEAGKVYDVTISYRNRSAGAIAAMALGVAGTAASAASGTVTTSFVASGASSTVGAQANADFIGSVYDMLVKERGAPASVQAIETTPEGQIVAYGCNERVSNVVNLRCIRWSGLAQAADESIYDWQKTAANNAGQYILEGGGRLVCARATAYGSFVLTDSELYFRTYRGDPDKPFDWTPMGTNCGACGPNAAAVLGSTLYWMSPQAKFWMATPGGTATPLFSTLARELSDNMAASQQDKVYASSLTEFGEVLWFYPDARDGVENSRHVSYAAQETARLGKPVWSKGLLARTTFLDANPGPYPIGVDTSGMVFWHERGASANGGALSWSLETGAIRVAEGNRVLMIKGFDPDFDDQVGAVNLYVYARMTRQGDEVEHGPYTLTPDQARSDFMLSGAFVRLKFVGDAAPSFARFGEPALDYTVRGKR